MSSKFYVVHVRRDPNYSVKNISDVLTAVYGKRYFKKFGPETASVLVEQDVWAMSENALERLQEINTKLLSKNLNPAFRIVHYEEYKRPTSVYFDGGGRLAACGLPLGKVSVDDVNDIEEVTIYYNHPLASEVIDGRKVGEMVAFYYKGEDLEEMSWSKTDLGEIIEHFKDLYEED